VTKQNGGRFSSRQKLQTYAITTEDVTKLDIIEPLVKEFGIPRGIHDHPRPAE
jgi:hypothetical protein